MKKIDTHQQKISRLKELYLQLPPDGKVRHVLRNFNFAPAQSKKLKSVKLLTEELGFDVERLALPKGVSGRLVKEPFSMNGYRIEVNISDNVLKQRWTVLHEIAHFFLHQNSDPFAWDQHRAHTQGDGHFYSLEEETQEREANWFVETLVFGDGALAAAVSLFGPDPERLSRYFGVSPSAVKIGLSKLKDAGR